MLFGTLQSKNNFGIIAILFLILCPLIITFSAINPTTYLVSETTQTAFSSSGIAKLNSSIAHFLGLFENSQFYLLSAESIKIQIFIAFAYTYHYLNWFSKTSIIGWSKNISKSKLIVIISIWLVSVFLYFYDYKTGLIALFFLSSLHVLLEFPLNIVSIKGIFSKLFINRTTQKNSNVEE
jgi:hypothetical protein